MTRNHKKELAVKMGNELELVTVKPNCAALVTVTVALSPTQARALHAKLVELNRKCPLCGEYAHKPGQRC